jgi:hypothetical protein
VTKLGVVFVFPASRGRVQRGEQSPPAKLPLDRFGDKRTAAALPSESVN